MRKVVVAGIGSTPFGRHPDVAIETLAIRAADAAIRETGLPRSEIGAVYLGNFVSGPLVGQEVLAAPLPTASASARPRAPRSKALARPAASPSVTPISPLRAGFA